MAFELVRNFVAETSQCLVGQLFTGAGLFGHEKSLKQGIFALSKHKPVAFGALSDPCVR